MENWSTDRPIYRQIKDQVVAQILDGVFAEGAAVPSVRQWAVDSQVNPLTVARAFQELADEGVLEKKRGLGMFVAAGSRDLLLDRERNDFLTNQWPALKDLLQRLRINIEDLK